VIRSRIARLAGHTAHTGDILNFMVGKHEGKRPLRKCRRRWEDNIKVDIETIGFMGADCIHMAQDRDQWLALTSPVMNFRVP
jgi:hypothetical protein